MRKRLLSLLLMLCMAMSFLPITASAESIQYVVAGSSSALFGTTWNYASDSGNIMTETSTGSYELRLSSNEACGTVYFTVAKLTDGYVISDSDYYCSASGLPMEINVSDSGEILIAFDPSTHEITVSGDNVTVVTGLQIDSMRTVGSGNGNWLNGVSWDPADDANLMTETSTGVYEITYTGISAASDYNFKFAANGEWSDNWGGSSDSENAVYNGNNIVFAVGKDNSTVRIVLDLTNFDYTTRTGAIYKLYVDNVQINGSDTPTSAEKNIILGTSALSGYDSTTGYKHVYYGTWNSSPIKWRVLDMAYKYNKNDTSKTSMLMLSENTLEATKFGISQTWNGSVAQTWCSNMYSSSFSENEQKSILQTNSDNILSNDRLFFLSSDEASNSAYFKDNTARKSTNSNGDDTSWWLRSPSSIAVFVSIVNKNGFIDNSMYSNENTCVARPAFNLNTESVLFTSSAAGGKGSDVGTLSANAANTGNEYKLTLKDSTRSNFTAKTYSASNEYVWISYENAKKGENEYISAIIVNADGEVTHYGKIANVTSESGIVSFSLTGIKLASTDTIYVFNEQINGDYKTDFASELKKISTGMVLSQSAASVYLINDKKATLILASYKDNTLKDIKTVSLACDTNAKAEHRTFEQIGLDTTDADSIKAFLWTDMETLTPLCNQEEVALNQSAS